jgi:hypothetical protein
MIGHNNSPCITFSEEKAHKSSLCKFISFLCHFSSFFLSASWIVSYSRNSHLQQYISVGGINLVAFQRCRNRPQEWFEVSAEGVGSQSSRNQFAALSRHTFAFYRCGAFMLRFSTRICVGIAFSYVRVHEYSSTLQWQSNTTKERHTQLNRFSHRQSSCPESFRGALDEAN